MFIRYFIHSMPFYIIISFNVARRKKNKDPQSHPLILKSSILDFDTTGLSEKLLAVQYYIWFKHLTLDKQNETIFLLIKERVDPLFAKSLFNWYTRKTGYFLNNFLLLENISYIP